MDRETIIKALRCSASVKPEGSSCEGCPYRLLEEITEEERKEFGLDWAIGTEIEGKRYWESCNTEKMALDAAEMLEKDKVRRYMHQLRIEEAISFERQLAEDRRQKIRKKSQQSFKNKDICINRWIEEANKHEQIAMLLERLKIMESIERTK